jgi:hypothetical protein
VSFHTEQGQASTRSNVGIDVMACPRCGGRLRLIATVDDPDAIRAILAAGAVSRELADRAPPFAPSLGTSHGAALSA